MKKPYDGDTKYLTTPLLEPGLTMSLGIICIKWSQLEMLLSHFYALLVFGDREQTDTAELTIIEAFESLPTWNTKTKLLVSAAHRRLGEDTGKKLQKLLKGFEKTHFARNNVVHARWSLPEPKESGQWVRKRALVSLEGSELYDTAEFVKIQNDIEAAGNRLYHFLDEIRPRLKSLEYLNPYVQALMEESKNASGG